MNAWQRRDGGNVLRDGVIDLCRVCVAQTKHWITVPLLLERRL